MKARACGLVVSLGMTLLMVLQSSAEPLGDKTDSPAADLVRAAIAAENSQDWQRRDHLLRQALQEDPEYGPARWRTGFVRQGDRWLSLGEVQERAAADPRLAEYRKLRDEQGADLASQLTLGRWCRDHGLPSEGRIHWLRVFQVQPQSAEALAALGLQWRQGQLVEQTSVKRPAKPRAEREAASQQEEGTKRWEQRIAQWRRASHGSRSDLMQSIHEAVSEAAKDPSAIDGLVKLLMSRRKPEEQETRQLLTATLIEVLGDTPRPWAGGTLAQLAVDLPDTSSRQAAAEALKKQPVEHAVPALLRRMRLPIEAKYTILNLGGSGALFQYSMAVQGPQAEWQTTWTGAVATTTNTRTIFDPRVDRSPSDQFRDESHIAAQNAARDRVWAVNTVAKQNQRVEAANTQTAECNRRVQQALSLVSGVDLEPDPLTWHKWWTNNRLALYRIEEPGKPYTPEDVEPGPEKPAREQVFAFSYTTVLQHSCFPYNTKVWTLTGPVQIDHVKPGDRVLSQDPESGELTYQPVLQVTMRKPAPMVKLGLGADTILATRGHPFWVPGAGWKIAAQLQTGMKLHAVARPVGIDALEEVAAAGPWYEQLKSRPDAKPEDVMSYNLIVDRSHTYFVGEQKILVHDILFSLDDLHPAFPHRPGETAL